MSTKKDIVVFSFVPYGLPNSTEAVQIYMRKGTKACFERRATALLSWLDCSSTAARHQHDLVSDVEFNSVELNGCCRKQNTKIKKRFSKLLKVF